MKFRKMKKASYIALSVGIAALIIFTALPYYLKTSIAFPDLDIYWSYADVQAKMLILFPGTAFLGAVTTLKKRNTVEDVFLNVAAPLCILLVLRCMQYHLPHVLAVFAICTGLLIYKIADLCLEDKFSAYNVRKRIRVIYYAVRKRGVLSLFLMLTPLTVWTVHGEYHNGDKYLRLLEAKSKVEYSAGEPVWDVVSKDQWESLTLNAKFEEFAKMVTYFLQDQGCEKDIKVYACKEITDETLAYYEDKTKSISVNVIYLDSCSYREAVRVAAHESQHWQQHEIIRAVEALEKAGFSYENNPYFAEAYALKAANERYGRDSIQYETYKNNLLEVKSEEYSEKMLEQLREEGYL